MSIFHHPEKLSNLISALAFHPNFPNPAPLYVGESSMFNIRWTLNYEVYFYLAFAFCIIVKPRLILLTCWFCAPVIAAYFSMPDVTFLTSGYEFTSVTARFLTNPIILDFGIGVIAGYIFKYLRNSNDAICFALAMISFFSIVAAIATGHLEGFSLITACYFALLVITFALADRYIVKFTPRFLIKLGDISFSWYLIHNPLSNFLSDKVEKLYPNAMHSTPGVIILLTASILMAFLSHKYVEVRLTRILRHVISKYMPGTSKEISRDAQAK